VIASLRALRVRPFSRCEVKCEVEKYVDNNYYSGKNFSNISIEEES
jgi:hypothetical protein